MIPATAGPTTRSQLELGLPQSECRHQIVLADHAGNGGVERRPVEPGDPPSRRGQDEEGPQRRLGEAAVDRQSGAGQGKQRTR